MLGRFLGSNESALSPLVSGCLLGRFLEGCWRVCTLLMLCRFLGWLVSATAVVAVAELAAAAVVAVVCESITKTVK